MKALLAALCAVLCGACSAQTYNRTVGTGASYADRTQPSEGIWINNGEALQVILPFDFPFYDRTYRVCWMTTQGVVKFQDNFNAGGVFNLTPPYFGGDLAAIHVFHSYLYGQRSVAPQTCSAVFENGIAVFQWRNVSVEHGQGMWLNFQVWLYPDGQIRMFWGPETVEVDVPCPFVSGLVPPTGTSGYSGFGGVLTAQTTRPAVGTEITLRPNGFIQSNGIDLSPMSYALCKPNRVTEGTSDNLTAAFVLNARGTGGTVTSLSYSIGSGTAHWSIKLYRDVAPFGVYDKNVDAPLKAQDTFTGVVIFTGLSEQIGGAAPSRGYFVVVDSITSSSLGWGSSAIYVSQGDVIANVPVWGGYRSELAEGGQGHVVSDGPVIEIVNDNLFPAELPPVYPGSSDNVIGSFAMHLAWGFTTPVEVTQLGWQMTGNGTQPSDFVNVRLWRDAGTLGALDAADTMIGEIQSPSSTFVAFGNLSEVVGAAESQYLLTFSIIPYYTPGGVFGVAYFSMDYASLQSSAPGAQFIGDSGSMNRHIMILIGTEVFLQRDGERSYYTLPAQPTEQHVSANAFTLRASFGVGFMTQIVFDGSTAGVSGAQLWFETGTLPGRYDAADTLIGNGTLGANTITFGALSVPVPSTPQKLLLTVNFSAGATAGNRQFNTQSINITCAGVYISGNSAGPTISVGSGIGAAGVDVTTSFDGNAFTLTGYDWVKVGRVSMVGRGAGGDPAELVLRLVDQGGGLSGASAEVLFVRDFGAANQWDSADLISNVGYQNLTFGNGLAITGSAPGINDVTTQRDFLILMRRNSFRNETGTLRILPGGINLGTNVRWTQLERQEPITLTLFGKRGRQSGRRQRKQRGWRQLFNFRKGRICSSRRVGGVAGGHSPAAQKGVNAKALPTAPKQGGGAVQRAPAHINKKPAPERAGFSLGMARRSAALCGHSNMPPCARLRSALAALPSLADQGLGPAAWRRCAPMRHPRFPLRARSSAGCATCRKPSPTAAGRSSCTCARRGRGAPNGSRGAE